MYDVDKLYIMRYDYEITKKSNTAQLLKDLKYKHENQEYYQIKEILKDRKEDELTEDELAKVKDLKLKLRERHEKVKNYFNILMKD